MKDRTHNDPLGLRERRLKGEIDNVQRRLKGDHIFIKGQTQTPLEPKGPLRVRLMTLFLFKVGHPSEKKAKEISEG